MVYIAKKWKRNMGKYSEMIGKMKNKYSPMPQKLENPQRGGSIGVYEVRFLCV